jgi:hypothetical protein
LLLLLLLLLLPIHCNLFRQLQAGYDGVNGSVPNGNATWQELLRRYCLLSRSSLRVKDSELKPGQQYATMSDDLIMVHAAVELGKQVRTAAGLAVLFSEMWRCASGGTVRWPGCGSVKNIGCYVWRHSC